MIGVARIGVPKIGPAVSDPLERRVSVTATRSEPANTRPTGGRGGRPTRFVRESISELRKVLWPSRSELITYSSVVIVFVVIMVSLVGFLDLGFAKLVLIVFG
jgi:preprotein translocase subunit SecE